MKKKWKWVWVLWGVFFGIAEFFAVRSPEEGDTLSEFVWSLLSIHNAIYFAGAGFLAWLVAHFLTRGRV